MVKQFCDICGEEIESPDEGSMFKLKSANTASPKVGGKG